MRPPCSEEAQKLPREAPGQGAPDPQPIPAGLLPPLSCPHPRCSEPGESAPRTCPPDCPFVSRANDGRCSKPPGLGGHLLLSSGSTLWVTGILCVWGGELYPRALLCYLGHMFSPSSRMSNTATSEHLPYASLDAKGSRESL